MFARSSRRGGAFKYHVTVHVARITLLDGVDNPPGKRFHLMWKKGRKVATTSACAGGNQGVLAFDETLSLVCTMRRDTSAPPGARALSHFQPKEASFTLLHCRDGRSIGSAKAVGRSKIDLAQYTGLDATREDVSLVLLNDGVPVGELRLIIAANWLKRGRAAAAAGDDDASLASDSDTGSFSDAGSFSDTSSLWGGGGDDDDDIGDLADVAGSDAAADAAADASLDSSLRDPDTEDEDEAGMAAGRAARRRRRRRRRRRQGGGRGDDAAAAPS